MGLVAQRVACWDPTLRFVGSGNTIEGYGPAAIGLRKAVCAHAAQHAPHSDTLTHDSHVQTPAPPHSLLNIQQRTLPPINIKQCAPT